MSVSGTVRERRDPPAARLPGELGAWMFVLADMSVFAFLFGAFLVDRSGQENLFHAGQDALVPALGLVNTLVLLSSSLLVATATRKIRHGESGARQLLLGAVACGFVFSALKVVEYVVKLSDGLTPQHDDFFMYYFVLTGVHWFHLLCGIAVLAFLVHLTGRDAPLSAQERSYTESGATFWHMVDLLWIVLFPLLYLV